MNLTILDACTLVTLGMLVLVVLVVWTEGQRK